MKNALILCTGNSCRSVMAGLGILFFEYLFAGLVGPEDAKEYIAGMILLGLPLTIHSNGFH